MDGNKSSLLMEASLPNFGNVMARLKSFDKFLGHGTSADLDCIISEQDDDDDRSLLSLNDSNANFMKKCNASYLQKHDGALERMYQRASNKHVEKESTPGGHSHGFAPFAQIGTLSKPPRKPKSLSELSVLNSISEKRKDNNHDTTHLLSYAQTKNATWSSLLEGDRAENGNGTTTTSPTWSEQDEEQNAKVNLSSRSTTTNTSTRNHSSGPHCSKSDPSLSSRRISAEQSCCVSTTKRYSRQDMYGLQRKSSVSKSQKRLHVDALSQSDISAPSGKNSVPQTGGQCPVTPPRRDCSTSGTRSRQNSRQASPIGVDQRAQLGESQQGRTKTQQRTSSRRRKSRVQARSTERRARSGSASSLESPSLKPPPSGERRHRSQSKKRLSSDKSNNRTTGSAVRGRISPSSDTLNMPTPSSSDHGCVGTSSSSRSLKQSDKRGTRSSSRSSRKSTCDVSSGDMLRASSDHGLVRTSSSSRSHKQPDNRGTRSRSSRRITGGVSSSDMLKASSDHGYVRSSSCRSLQQSENRGTRPRSSRRITADASSGDMLKASSDHGLVSSSSCPSLEQSNNHATRPRSSKRITGDVSRGELLRASSDRRLVCKSPQPKEVQERLEHIHSFFGTKGGAGIMMGERKSARDLVGGEGEKILDADATDSGPTSFSQKEEEELAQEMLQKQAQSHRLVVAARDSVNGVLLNVRRQTHLRMMGNKFNKSSRSLIAVGDMDD